ncbi:hypothetical protein V1264_024593 [Littorina saxatilis]|uniref:Uncharacterized protein n=1 Tax=Littorina saxatilis TaxID=31220 RepID=A0AAN9ALJ6_9CAEN
MIEGDGERDMSICDVAHIFSKKNGQKITTPRPVIVMSENVGQSASREKTSGNMAAGVPDPLSQVHVREGTLELKACHWRLGPPIFNSLSGPSQRQLSHFNAVKAFGKRERSFEARKTDSKK